MPELIIEGQRVHVAKGATLLDAARELAIDIPTLCHFPGREAFTSCMLCVVQHRRTGELVPACSAAAGEGLDIVTSSEAVRAARRDALELLLSDHAGDCEAPCRRLCPAQMDIPRMLREIVAGDLAAAIRTVKRDIPLPAILGRICPAPCERVCRRRETGGALSICLLKRYVADADLQSGAPFIPVCKPASGRRVAVAGAGPAGLTAAYYLALMGHRCVLLDPASAPGGALRSEAVRDRLPPEVLAAEAQILERMGVEFQGGCLVGRDVSLDDLSSRYDALVLAIGPASEWHAGEDWPHATHRGFVIDRHTFRTDREGVFACGAAAGPCRMAVRAVAEGKAAALAVDRMLRGAALWQPRPFDSRLQHIEPEEMKTLLLDGVPGERSEPSAGTAAGFDAAEACHESERCLQCACRRAGDCRLRDYAGQYEASQRRYTGGARRPVRVVRDHPDLRYEPGKCIACGLCVRVAGDAGETPGLTFTGRGFDVLVDVPFGESLAAGLRSAASACAHACPTGALSLREAREPE